MCQQPRRFLAFQQGLGKTPISIRAADELCASHILVICPAIATYNWAAEFEKWQLFKRSVQVLDGKKDYPQADVVICSYERAVKQKALLQNFAPDVLIIDEAHYIKNPTAKRTKVIYGHLCRMQNCIASCAQRVWLLSGTPMPNHSGELWTHLRALWPSSIAEASQASFVRQFCHTVATPFGDKIVSNKNQDRLVNMLRSVMARETTERVLKDLPPLRHETAVIKSDSRYLNRVRELLEQHPELEDVESLLGEDQAILIPHVATLRRLTALAKAEAAAEYINLIAEQEPVVVFGIHREPLGIVREQLKHEFSFVDGSTPQHKRGEEIRRFQGGETQIFVGQLQSCATAINLQRASRVVFMEASWTPAENAQAIKRCHRIGTKFPVLGTYLALAGTIDEQVAETLARKTRLIDEIVERTLT